MPLLTNLKIDLSPDQVIRAQGADPVIIRERKPQIAIIAEQAIKKGSPLLDPKVLYQEFSVEKVVHEKIHLSEGSSLKGQLVSQHLAPAKTVIVMVATIGHQLEQFSLNVFKGNPSMGLALEGVGSAAVEVLANAACNHFEKLAVTKNAGTTIPVSPGMIGWTLAEGQPQIFSMLNTDQIDVRLTESLLMMPRKTLSMVIGMGPDVSPDGSTCDFCSLRETCQYKDHFAHQSSPA